MIKIGIIGAGQLGSRHLQGLLSVSKTKFKIFVVDNSKESLQLAKQRAGEINHKHELNYDITIDILPVFLDFVIIATSSMVRLSIIKQLLNKRAVKYLILEKVLFPEIKQYEIALGLIKKNKVKCWVNHPRRMYKNYQSIKKYFDTNESYFFQLVGRSWGLACNGLHFIDLFEYLTSSSLSSISCEFLNTEVKNSKRDGYIEFTGTITGMLENKHMFSISCSDGDELIAPSISILSDKIRIFIQESDAPKIYVHHKESTFVNEPINLILKYQSQLTGDLIEQIMSCETCDLPFFEHAAQTHKKFIKSFLDRWNSIRGTNDTILPIT